VPSEPKAKEVSGDIAAQFDAAVDPAPKAPAKPAPKAKKPAAKRPAAN
jgi:hypothetical protein